MVDGLRRAAPVRTGRLRRSIAARKVGQQWRPTARVLYADVVNRRGRSRGWVNRGLAQARGAVKRELERAGAGHLPIPRTMRSVRWGTFTASVEEAIFEYETTPGIRARPRA